ncbi:MAG: hypothetical protein RDU59_01520 [Thermodesulfobacteriota bacterium]|nr:hypothetical protein [Thermodesulfobacteriota bacterium]
MGDKYPNTMEKRTWLRKRSEDNNIYVYLVESPLTFGHSQLILKTENVIPEEDMFGMAAPVLVESIRILKEKIPGAMEDLVWKKLRDYTQASGRLIKILILKVSANEKEKQYKVHIVPYFESHLCLTTILFQKGRDIDKGKTGGMIRWLGEQEKRVDDQIEIWRDTCHFPVALVESFELIKLADHLRGKEYAETLEK